MGYLLVSFVAVSIIMGDRLFSDTMNFDHRHATISNHLTWFAIGASLWLPFVIFTVVITITNHFEGRAFARRVEGMTFPEVCEFVASGCQQR